MIKFFVFAFIYLLINLYSNYFLINESHYYRFYGIQLTQLQIERLILRNNQYEWLSYFFIPIFYFTKISLINLSLYVGGLLSLDNRMTLKNIGSSVVLADSVFLIPSFIKVVWFSFQPDYTLEDLQYFMPGSLLNLFNPKEIEPWLVYPLQSINIWEVAFWFALAYELKEYFEDNFASSFGTVMASYGSGLVIWIVFVVFLTLNFS